MASWQQRPVPARGFELQLHQKGYGTVHGLSVHKKIEPTGEDMATTDQCPHQTIMINYGSSKIGSDNTQETSLDVGKELIVGREKEKDRMASKLEGMPGNIIIFPIYGIGGIGKTTFARLIYNAANFKDYAKVWVYVSPRFDLCEIGKSIISELDGKEKQDDNKLEEIKCHLTNLLSRSKKILIVLDDLWEKNTIRLEDLKDLIEPGNSIKTIVLVTTRSEDTAKKICSNIEPYKVEPLTDGLCWYIIKQKSFFEARHAKENLVDIGKDIARKCGGVALAAQTLGSMLQSMDFDQWMTVRDSNIWNQSISNDTSLSNHVLASLKLSYVFSMDACLKSCFTYCAIFPKGHKIVKYDLIYQWMSLDFINPTKLLTPLERCEKYIMDLLGLSFLQHSISPMTYRAYGEHDEVFTMHDLVHDLAISLLGDGILDQSIQCSNTAGSSCRYTLLTDCSKPLETCTTSARLAIHFLDCRTIELHGAAFEAAECLRVLDLSACSTLNLPDSIGRLKQLRYLNAPKIRNLMVPECITKLSNLRYLSLHGSKDIRELPKSIGEMKALVHLDLSGCMGIKELPGSFYGLEGLEHVDFTNCLNVKGLLLQTLPRNKRLQYLNLSNCINCGYLPGAVWRWPTLFGELRYLNLSNCPFLSLNEFSMAQFWGSLTNLEYLNLSSRKILLHTTMLPEALGTLNQLKYLNISFHYSLKKLPASFGNLCNLVHLDLSCCYSLQDVPANLNGLTKLQYLNLYCCSGSGAMEGLEKVIGNLSELRHLNYSERKSVSEDLLERICTLTNLEYLILNRCDGILSIPEAIGKLRKLHTLDISYCQRLQRLPESISKIDTLKFLHTEGCLLMETSNSRICDREIIVLESAPDVRPASLRIGKLENVKSAKEVSQIKVEEKIHITLLIIEWTRDAMRLFVEDDQEVLRELEPRKDTVHHLKGLDLRGYNSASFPPWVMHINAYFPGLVTISMSDLPNCIKLPPLGQLLNLEFLDIRRMDSIKKIDADLYGRGTRAFPRLQYFTIDGMKCLEVWNMPYSSQEDGMNEAVFPCLVSLRITNCPRLRFKPRSPLSTETSVASRFTCSSLDFLRGLTSLQTLTLKDCESITSLPDSIQQLTRLEKLSISGCPELVKWCESRKNKRKLTHIKTRDLQEFKLSQEEEKKL